MLRKELVFPKDYKIIYNWDNENLDDFIQSHYTDLYDFIMGERYVLDYLNFDLFREIKCEGEIIGFIALKILEEKRFSIEECYIIPEFRKKGIIYDELLKLGSVPNVYLYARRPNYAFISMLKKHGACEKITENIVSTGIEIIADSTDVYVNDDIDFLYDLKRPVKDLFSDYVYDFDSKLIFIQDMWGNITSNIGLIGIITPRTSDLKRYYYKKTFAKFNDYRIEKTSARLFHKHSQIENGWGAWESKLTKYNDIKAVAGSEKRLSDEMSWLLKDNALECEIGFKIRNHILQAIDKVELKKKYSRARRDYLLENPSDIAKMVVDDIVRDENGIRCPFCGQYSDRYYENCDHCGFDFENWDYRKRFS